MTATDPLDQQPLPGPDPLGRAMQESRATQTQERRATQEIRLAVVLNGGVSLAIWISGVALELHRLVQASRKGDADARRQDPYAQLLDLLQASARIDVIAGTSAGGLNGGFLALGLVRGVDLTLLRGLWEDQGDLSTLLRDPRHKDAPSLLRGDYFHKALTDAYQNALTAKSSDRPAPEGDTVDLFLTGTLWDGRRTPFADDMGRRIVETDHDATFHFTSDPDQVGQEPQNPACGDLRTDAVAEQLAVASRCTSSFPAAFEPYLVDVDGQERVGERWQSSAGRANFSTSQFVVDGGVLRNKPIRPAIDAVYRQSASQQVRRILAYVVPDPGEEAPDPLSPVARASTAPPGAHEVLLGVMTRLRSTDSVANELDEIRRRNEDTRQRRRTRDRLAETLLVAQGTSGVVASAFPAYLDVRRESAARTVAEQILANPTNTQWSRREIATVLRDLLATEPAMPFIPDSPLPPDEALAAALNAPGPEWRWGQTTVGRLGDLVVDLLKRAVWLAGPRSPHYPTIVAQREVAHQILTDARALQAKLNEYWRGKPLPSRSPAVAASPAEIAELRRMLLDAAKLWGGDQDATRGAVRAKLKQQALDLAGCLLAGREALQSVSAQPPPTWDLNGDDHTRFSLLSTAILGGAEEPDAVLRNMLQLEVLHVGFAGASADIEQEVELVQVSSMTPELLTGVQLHHFGAFYRRSWRTNDWLRGRLDGCQQLVEMLLAPERLRQLGHDAATTLAAIRDIAVGPDNGPNHDEFEAGWRDSEQQVVEELSVLSGDEPLPRTFPHCAERIAHRLTVGLLEEELRALAKSVDAEGPDALPESRDWAARADEGLASGGGSTRPSVRELVSLLDESKEIGRQRIQDEMTAGSDTYAKTVTHAAGAVSATASTFKRPKPVAAVLSTFRGYTIMLWVMVNFLANKSNVGRNAVAVAIGVGGTLIALTLILPAVPTAVTLAGILLVLAAASAAALRDKPLMGNRARGWRLLAATVLVLAALVGVVVEQLLNSERSVADILIGLGLRVGVVLLIVGFGWFIAYDAEAKKKARQERAAAKQKGRQERAAAKQRARRERDAGDQEHDAGDQEHDAGNRAATSAESTSASAPAPVPFPAPPGDEQRQRVPPDRR